MKYDYLIVGSGLFGSVFAKELTNHGYKCLVIDSRNHIGGNCYTENKDGINIHTYGAHIFHTSNKKVWDWINQYSEFNNYRHHVIANYNGELYSLPFSMWTFNKLWNVTKPEEVKEIIKNQSIGIDDPKNLEEQAIKLVGVDVYEKLIKGYTTKQWRKDPKELPKEIVKRLPVRFIYDNNYFNDKYQGIPVGGYTKIFEKLLDGIDVELNKDYLVDKEYWNSVANKVIYTGPIDRFYNYQFGELEYKTVKFEHKRYSNENFQGTSVVNYTDLNTPYTRIIEHKHFEYSDSPVSWITYETPVEYVPNKTEPYYPVNDFENNEKYQKYYELMVNENNMIFGGRLADYKYYDMHQVIEVALNRVSKEISSRK